MRRKFSRIGGRASEYRLLPDHFQTVKRMLAPDWAQKNALYYCAQSANNFVTAPGCPRMAKEGRQKGSTERTRLIFSHHPQTSLFNKELITLSDMD